MLLIISFFVSFCHLKELNMKGSPGAVVKMLPCDHEVMGSSPRNNLLQKCKERLRT
jgi:hypothetical protein